MATDKPRFSVTFTDEAFSKIQQYQKENNISTQSKAVARLVEIGLEDMLRQKSDGSALYMLNPDERRLVDDYRLMNPQGQEYIRQTMYMATQTYKKTAHLSDLEKQA